MDAAARSRFKGVPADDRASLLSFEEVYERYANPIRRFCVVQMRDASAAEDVTADTFMKAFQAYERVRPAPDEVQFWLLRIARNTALNAQRRTRIAAIFGRRHHQEQSEDVEHTVEVRQDLRRVLDAAEDLSSRDRELVALRISGLAFSEIGVLMRISADAAGVATRRAMERLRVQYEGLAK